MPQPPDRREFLQQSLPQPLLASALAGAAGPRGDAPGEAPPARKIRVVVWDERQKAQKEVYPDFLGNWIARYLEGRPDLSVRSVALDDPQQGLGPDVLGACEVLLWWGHARQAEITPRAGQAIVERIKGGTLSLIALHSAHWATPFVEAMYERTRQDAARKLRAEFGDKVEVAFLDPPRRYTLPRAGDRLTPRADLLKFPDGRVKASVHLPWCCFPAYRADGKPSQVRVLLPDHPVARGLPRQFEIPHTEMYNEPFHVPEPDEVILEERWAGGEWFRSGMAWKIGAGRVFYFRPGHETFAVYKEKIVLQLLENAVRWLAPRGK